MQSSMAVNWQCFFATPAMGATELHVGLHLVAGLGLLVALPPLFVALVSLVGGKPSHAQAVEDPPHPGLRHLDITVPLEVHGDLQRTEAVVLAQIHDPAHDL